jgi:hypothetical protein
MTDVPQWCWWVPLALAVVLATSLAVGAANAHAQRRARAQGTSFTVGSWRHLGRAWWSSAVAVLMVLLALVLVGVPRVAGGYSSTALVSLTPRDPIATSADTMLLLGPRYLTLLENPDVLAKAARDAGTTSKALLDGSRATIEATTLVVDIRFASDDPATAARSAQALATALLDEVAQDGLVKGRLIGSAVTPDCPSVPTVPQALVAGALLALAGAAVVGAAVRRRSLP